MSLIVTLRGGRTVTGWRAWLYAIPMFPVLTVFLLVALLDALVNTLIGRGTWIREGWAWTWKASKDE